MLSLEQKIMTGRLLTPSDFEVEVPTEKVLEHFIRRHLVVSLKRGSVITSTVIYPIYKKFSRETYPQVQVVPKPRMTEILSTPDKLGKQENRKWYGLVVRR